MLPYFALLFGASEGCQTILVFKRESFIETNLQYIMQQAIPKLLPIYEHKAIFWKGILLFCLQSQNATIYQTGHGKWRTQEGNLYDFHWVIHVLPVDVTELFQTQIADVFWRIAVCTSAWKHRTHTRSSLRIWRNGQGCRMAINNTPWMKPHLFRSHSCWGHCPGKMQELKWLFHRTFWRLPASI